MNKKYLIKMIDGGLVNVVEDDWCESSGCDTCEYGSEYIRELTLELDGFNLEIQLGDMYYTPYSEGELMELLCNNTDLINNMTQDDFVTFIKKELVKLSESKRYEYDPKFRIVKEI